MHFSARARTRRTVVVGFSTAAAVAACVLLPPHLTLYAFFPTNLKTLGGLLGTSHVKITNEAITEIDDEFFAITKLTKSMKKAKEQIADANADVDQDQKTASKHVDGESFPEAQQRIIDRFNGVKTALAGDDAAGARKELGAALHTIQDFYSHSNWVEMGGSSPNSSLGRPGSTIGKLPVTTATCKDCTGGLPPLVCPDCSANLLPAGLTSGYYGGEDPPFGVKPAGKCSHGGALDSSAKGLFGEGINKDSTDCEFSPHNFLHNSAVAVAKEATKQFIRDIKGDVTPRQIKLLLGVGPTLAISIDTTGSMGSIIDGVKQQAIQIVNARLDTDEEPSKYVLSPFNDPGVGPLTVTTDADQFKGAISALYAYGGDDCPELSQSGMLQALAAADEGGDLFMFTDASSKDAGLAGNVSSLATSKDIRVYPMIFGSCSPIDPSYIRAAADSGGQLFFLSRSEAGKITRLADLIVRSNAASVLLIGDTVAGTPKVYPVPVDSTMTRATFSVGGTLSGATVALSRPDGTTVQPTDPGVTLLSLNGNYLYTGFSYEFVGGGLVYSIANPPTGLWSVAVNGSGDFSLKVSGESPLDLSSFRFVRLGGRPGHQGFFPIDGLPLAGEVATADSVVSGPFSTTHFQLRNRVGELLQSLNLTGVPETTDEFSGTLTPPNSSFLVYLTGQDAAGKEYQRVLSGGIRPQTVGLIAPVAHDLPAGQTTTYTFKVTNGGAAADTFSVVASDDRRFLTSVSPTSLTLAAGASVDVLTQLLPPETTPAGTSDTLTLTVQSTGAPDTRNFAVVTSVVTLGGGNQPPQCELATPNLNTLWPANHKMAEVTILGVTDPDSDPVTIRVDSVKQDEPTNGLGDGDASPDASGIGTSSAFLRSERSGAGNGRVYTILFTALDGRGNTCQSSVNVCVPHNAGESCVNGGSLFDSTVSPR
jgi:hypothetical protein